MKVKFSVPIKPVAKQRPRLAKNGHVYTPKDTKTFENLIAYYYGHRYCFDEYIKVKVVFRFEIPKSYSKKKRKEALEGAIRPTRSDLDNYIKSLLDGLNTRAWKDDRYIVKIEAEKKYSLENGIDVIIESIDERENEYE